MPDYSQVKLKNDEKPLRNGCRFGEHYLRVGSIPACDFRGRLRFPRAGVEPPRLRLRGLPSSAFPAGVFVYHSNHLLEMVNTHHFYDLSLKNKKAKTAILQPLPIIFL